MPIDVHRKAREKGMSNLYFIQVGEEIRRRRLALGWSLEQLADACGITRNYLGTVERGRRDPHVSTLLSIARALGCTITELLGHPDADTSSRGLEMARLYERSAPHVQDAVTLMMRLLVKADRSGEATESSGEPQKPAKKGGRKGPRKPRDTGTET